MVAVRKHVVLVRQVGAARVDQVNAGQAVLLRHFLCAQVLFDRHRVIGAALDGGVVADNHAVHPVDAADAGDHAGTRRAVAAIAVRVHDQCGQWRQLEERRARVQQHLHPLARWQLAARHMFGSGRLPTACGRLGELHLQIGHQRAHGSRIGLKIRRAGVEFCLQKGHVFLIAARAAAHQPHLNAKPANTDPGSPQVTAAEVANRANFAQTPLMLARPAASPPVPAVAATPMAFARVIAQSYTRSGQSPALALKQAHITPAKLQQQDARITARQMEVLSGAAMQELDDEALGAFSRKLPWGSYGMLARASLSAPNLGVALKRWCRHHGLLTDDIRLKLLTSGETAAVSIEESPSLSRLGQAAREFCLVHVLRNIHGLACWYIDSRIALRETRFPFAAPLHADAYALMFPGSLRFEAAQAEIRFDARYLALPLRRDEKALAQMLQRALPLTVLQYRRDRLLVQQVRQALATHPEQAHNASGVAALLNISARTLHRQLKEEGASLQALKDEVRFERARELLERSDRPVKQVAVAAGFRNEKSFARAFRSWTGANPGEFRRGVK